MRAGLVTTTLRQIKSLEEVVKIAKDAGAECIEWGGDVHVTDVESAVLAKKLCKKAGIDICSYGSYYRVGSCNESEWLSICEIAHAMNAKYIRVWLGREDSEKTDSETYARLLCDLKSMCATAEKYGIAVCPECHGNTYNNNTDAFLKIRKDVGFDNFKTYFQSLYRRKEYDLDRIERTSKYIEGVHISFFEQFREQFPKHKPGYINALIKKLKEVGYNGDVMIEFSFYSYQHGVPSAVKKDILKLKDLLQGE